MGTRIKHPIEDFVDPCRLTLGAGRTVRTLYADIDGEKVPIGHMSQYPSSFGIWPDLSEDRNVIQICQYCYGKTHKEALDDALRRIRIYLLSKRRGKNRPHVIESLF